MAATIWVRNPEDGTETYDQIVPYRASSYGGSYSSQTAVSIDVTNADDLGPGFTKINDSGGSSTSFYKYLYKNSSNSDTTPLSSPFPANTSDIHSRIRQEMKDNDANNFFWNDGEIQEALRDAVQELYPRLYRRVLDKTLTTTSDEKEYTVPNGIFKLVDPTRVETYDSSSPPKLQETLRAQDIVGNKLRFLIAPTTSGNIIYLDAYKKIRFPGEVPAVYESIVIMLSAKRLLQKLANDRTRYNRYVTIVRQEQGSAPNLEMRINTYDRQVLLRKNELTRSKRAVAIGMAQKS